jgi:hypothetical protein
VDSVRWTCSFKCPSKGSRNTYIPVQCVTPVEQEMVDHLLLGAQGRFSLVTASSLAFSLVLSSSCSNEVNKSIRVYSSYTIGEQALSDCLLRLPYDAHYGYIPYESSPDTQVGCKEPRRRQLRARRAQRSRSSSPITSTMDTALLFLSRAEK